MGDILKPISWSNEMSDKISQQVAEEQFGVLEDYYDLDVNDIDHKEQKAAAKMSKSRIIKSIRKGRLQIALQDGTIAITQTLQKPPGEVATLEYAELSGRHKISMKDSEDNYVRMYALVGAMTGLNETAISNLKGVDLSLVECLGSLFLLV
jgi:ribosomal protein S4E